MERRQLHPGACHGQHHPPALGWGQGQEWEQGWASRALHTTARLARDREPDPTGGARLQSQEHEGRGGGGVWLGRGGGVGEEILFDCLVKTFGDFYCTVFLISFYILCYQIRTPNFSELFPYLVSLRQTLHRPIHGSEAPNKIFIFNLTSTNASNFSDTASQWLPPP